MRPGRGIVESALYLPQLRIPAVSGSTPARPPRTREQNPEVILRRRFAENFGRRSDSEGEENISEADRDARLAFVMSCFLSYNALKYTSRRSRPQRIHVAVAHDNDSISSGDEEDDDDLTETYHSDSDDEHREQTFFHTGICANSLQMHPPIHGMPCGATVDILVPTRCRT